MFDQGKLSAKRPHLLVVNDCSDFTLDGSLTLLDAPMFNIALKNVHRAVGVPQPLRLPAVQGCKWRAQLEHVPTPPAIPVWPHRHPLIHRCFLRGPSRITLGGHRAEHYLHLVHGPQIRKAYGAAQHGGTRGAVSGACDPRPADVASSLSHTVDRQDGIDPGSGSSDIWIHNVYISNGDDSVAVKPNTGACTRNILVENCEFHNGHGCSIGSVGSGCVENVVFRNISMWDQENGCRVKSYSSTEGAGFVRNITWDTIFMNDTVRWTGQATRWRCIGSLLCTPFPAVAFRSPAPNSP